MNRHPACLCAGHLEGTCNFIPSDLSNHYFVHTRIIFYLGSCFYHRSALSKNYRVGIEGV